MLGQLMLHGLMNGQQLLRAVFITGIGSGLKPGRLVLVVGNKIHAKQGIEATANRRAKTVGGVDGNQLGAGGQLVQDVGLTITKDRKRAGQNMLVKVARANEHAIAAAHQIAQHQHGGFVQVLQLIEQHGIKAACQRLKHIFKIQRTELNRQRISAVAGSIKLRLVIEPGAKALVLGQQPVQAVVEFVILAILQGVEA